MALKIIWTEQAKYGLQKVLDFLEQNWLPATKQKEIERSNEGTNISKQLNR